MWTLAYVSLGLIGIALAMVAVIYWFSSTLLKGWTGDCFSHLPEHQQEIERARHEYELGEELGYPGEILLGLESKVSAAVTKAEEASAVVLKKEAEAAIERSEQARCEIAKRVVAAGKSAEAFLAGAIVRGHAGKTVILRD